MLSTVRRGGRLRPVRRQRRVDGRQATLTLKRAFFEDVRAAALHDKIRGLRLPLLTLHSPTDNTVGIANARSSARQVTRAASFRSRVRTIYLPAPEKRAARVGSSAHGRTRISAPSNRYHIGIP